MENLLHPTRPAPAPAVVAGVPSQENEVETEATPEFADLRQSLRLLADVAAEADKGMLKSFTDYFAADSPVLDVSEAFQTVKARLPLLQADWCNVLDDEIAREEKVVERLRAALLLADNEMDAPEAANDEPRDDNDVETSEPNLDALFVPVVGAELPERTARRPTNATSKNLRLCRKLRRRAKPRRTARAARRSRQNARNGQSEATA